MKYIRAQLDTAIHQMEEISGKKFDEDKFEQCCQNANRTAKAWLKVCDYLQYKPAPFNGFDLFNHMADVVTARGRVEAAEAFELLASELEQHVKDGTTTAPFKEQHRIMFEGIPCWPKLPNLFKPLKANGLNSPALCMRLLSDLCTTTWWGGKSIPNPPPPSSREGGCVGGGG